MDTNHENGFEYYILILDRKLIFMKGPKTFKEAVNTFERYYDDWIKSEEYQLKVLFKQGRGGPHRDDGKLATGAIVAIMAVLKDSSISRDLHSLDCPLNTSTETCPLPYSPEKLEQIKKVVEQKMRTLLQGEKHLKVVSQLYDFLTPRNNDVPLWVREFYVSCALLLMDICGVIYHGR